MRIFLASLALTLALPFTAAASGEEGMDADEIVRLPGQPAARPDRKPPPGGLPGKGERLVAGGILILSFDTNGDGTVSPEELGAGIPAAFAEADANGDGQLTALEQQAWAAGMPVRDDTLANPVRFDPNLDRIVTLEEFTTVIHQLAASYEAGDGSIAVASLTAPDRPEKEDRRYAQSGGDLPGETGPNGGPGAPRR